MRTCLHALPVRVAHFLHICGVKSGHIFPNTPSALAATESCASWARTRRKCSNTRRPVSSLCGTLTRPTFRAPLFRMLLLVLYCTGIRFGEALQLRYDDVDVQAGVLFVRMFKGRARWVPFHRSLAREMEKYLLERQSFAGELTGPDERFFVGATGKALSVSSAGHTIQKLFQNAGLKPAHGRVGPRPYDFRHTFAVHRLSRWYRQGADLYARLPWLSAYMGHDDILGTETYLTATPELLELAGNRLRSRYLKPSVRKELK